MNNTALLAVADVIESHNRFDLSTPVGYKDVTKRPSRYDCDLHVKPDTLWKDCKTVGCVAGWTCAWADAPVEVWEQWGPISEWAQTELELTDDQARNLFFSGKGSAWIEVYGDPRPYTAAEAADLLRKIAKGEVKAMK